MIETNEDYLLQVKRKVDQANKKKGELIGRKKTLLEQLEKGYGIKSSKEVEKHLEKLELKLTRIQEQIEEKLTYIKKNYDL